MYVVSTKSIGFNLEVLNNDASTVITGFRVLLGSQDTTRVPSFIQVILGKEEKLLFMNLTHKCFVLLQVFGRTVNVVLTRARWYDVPLSREESLQADSKLVITFGPSHDPQSVTFVDSVKM